ncbi:M23 family metallopeptidase [Defluviimonas salinarum]|uniref:M23 family metallopeptidase n=1 Tax=Defluviimonas salinarum TaxID=2992147 RepID=A0ABT3J4J0_9RHOB|nr:M23 family metallopeptidase [Defluviimonas salinarum]MCW3782593.1 M23 family metallopeptidase [Defluviimonas salinarum]
MLYLPYGSDEKKVSVGQATNSQPSHLGLSYTALDFSLKKNDAVYAMADGVVVAIYNEAVDYKNGNTVYDAPGLPARPGAEGSFGASGYGNFVTILHTVDIDGETITFYATYAHLEQNSMGSLEVGAAVTGGATFLGEVGYTGKIIGEHLHIQVGTELNIPQFPAETYAYAKGDATAANLELISKLTFETAGSGAQTWSDIIAYKDSFESTIDVAKVKTNISKSGDGFENPALDGWTKLGDVSSEVSFDVFQPGSSSPATPVEGSRMAVLQSLGEVTTADIEAALGLAPGQLPGTTGSAMTTTVKLSGSDHAIGFEFYFDAGDYTPYNDAAYVVVDKDVYLLADVNGVGDYGDTGWQSFAVSGLAKGDHRVSFVVVDAIDEILNSALYVDEFLIL